ncbi:MAG: Gfo/Idh/MocA family oxidoreductase [Kiritimatiellae bacterium]|nr:Gfo/Idh/MocA family oxidoreductase [Kiritimatiellia bacterium]
MNAKAKATEELGIGLVGCGRWGQLLANAVQELGGARMAAVQNRTFARAREFAATLNVPAYKTYQELVKDPNVDAILVVNPHNLHEPVVAAAAKAGKHIFCEKPLAIDVAACHRMIDITDKYGVKMMCGHIRRLCPTYRKAAEIVHSGRLGALAAVNIANMVHIDRVNWWAKSETMGALLHSPGVHVIDYLLSLCGTARSVYAVESRVRVQPRVDYQDSLFLTVEFENGAIGSVQCTVSCLTPGNQVQVVGTLGSLRFDPGKPIDVALWSGKKERVAAGSDGSWASEERAGVDAELANFIDWVANGDEPLLTAWDGLRAVEIVDAAYRSIARQRPIELPLPKK